VAFRRSGLGQSPVSLWPALGGEPGATEHWLELSTAAGPRLLLAYDARVLALRRAQVRPIPGVLRRFLALSHVVGIAVLGDELVWLVDSRRFRPTFPPASSAQEAG
jgi:hypothetical protein